MSKSPVAIIILDGFGWRPDNHGNAVNQANKPNFDCYMSEFPNATMKASGLEVGLPEGQMGPPASSPRSIGQFRPSRKARTQIRRASLRTPFRSTRPSTPETREGRSSTRAVRSSAWPPPSHRWARRGRSARSGLASLSRRTSRSGWRASSSRTAWQSTRTWAYPSSTELVRPTARPGRARKCGSWIRTPRPIWRG